MQEKLSRNKINFEWGKAVVKEIFVNNLSYQSDHENTCKDFLRGFWLLTW